MKNLHEEYEKEEHVNIPKINDDQKPLRLSFFERETKEKEEKEEKAGCF